MLKLPNLHKEIYLIIPLILLILSLILGGVYTKGLKDQVSSLTSQMQGLINKLNVTSNQLDAIKNVDQYLKNIHDNYLTAMTIYEKLLDLKNDKLGLDPIRISEQQLKDKYKTWRYWN